MEHNSIHAKFLLAVQANDISKVIAHLKDGANVDTTDSGGDSALLNACYDNEFDMIRILTGWDANLNIRNNDGSTPLLELFKEYETNFDIIKYLVRHGARVKDRDNYSQNIIHRAVFSQNLQFVIYASKLYGNIDKKDANGCTPLFLASELGCFEIVEFLHKNGADIHTKNKHNQFALSVAMKNDCSECFQYLLNNGCEVNEADFEGITGLEYACASDDIATMELLIEHGAEISAIISRNRTMLHVSVENEASDSARFVIKNGVPIEAKDDRGRTAFDLALRKDDLEMMELLFDHGAGITKLNSKEQTILHRASIYGLTNAVKFALAKGIRVGKLDAAGKSAFDFAKANNNNAIHKLLVDYYAKELKCCIYCPNMPAHIQFGPCGHSDACSRCCSHWKRCKCGSTIIQRVDLLAGLDGKPWNQGRYEEEVQHECSICLDRPKNIALNCGHTCCEECSQNLQRCHICRQPIQKKLRFY